ncbi:MAG: TetR family transcriptional regulator, partial [Ilumatobacteraceae bacterium]|nr:TetR family transcriptional regulator [Ilumatobacteraceae bacterium]
MRLVEEGRTPETLGVREVARAAGIAAPSIYNHFADMDQLGLALVDDALIRLRGVARAARSSMSQRDPEAALPILMQQFLVYMNKFEPVLRLVILQWF